MLLSAVPCDSSLSHLLLSMLFEQSDGLWSDWKILFSVSEGNGVGGIIEACTIRLVRCEEEILEYRLIH